MKAYAILAGGGVKGAALAGCLLAAEEMGIEFLGYGGTSAGSIVALLAAVGYTATDIRRIMVSEINFYEFLDDGGTALTDAQKGLNAIAEYLQTHENAFKKLGVLPQSWRVAKNVWKDLGLYHGDRLKKFLRDKVVAKFPQFENKALITFQDLTDAGCKPLKIVASDVRLAESLTYSSSGDKDVNEDVTVAVRASISFPFVFKPIRQNDRRLVDGGLCSNLPVSLFDRERRETNFSRPIVAFDLISKFSALTDDYGFAAFVRDIVHTALEASDKLMRQSLADVYYVPVVVPDGIGTLDFKLSPGKREDLFRAGHSHATSELRRHLPYLTGAKTSIERLQALRGDPKLINFLLGIMADSFESKTSAKSIRASIMLPLDENRRIVVYQHGMDFDADIDLELALDGGCSGQAWSERSPAYADLERSKATPMAWRMTQAEQNKVRPDRKAMISVPVFVISSLTSGAKKKVAEFPLLGTLSIDTATNLSDTEWVQDGLLQRTVLLEMRYWADTFGKLLTEKETSA